MQGFAVADAVIDFLPRLTRGHDAFAAHFGQMLRQRRLRQKRGQPFLQLADGQFAALGQEAQNLQAVGIADGFQKIRRRLRLLLQQGSLMWGWVIH